LRAAAVQRAAMTGDAVDLRAIACAYSTEM
jgi:hypothetical protein